MLAKVLTHNNSWMGTRWKIEKISRNNAIHKLFQGCVDKFQINGSCKKARIKLHWNTTGPSEDAVTVALQVYSSLGCYSPIMSFSPWTHFFTLSLLHGTSFKRSYSSLLLSVCRLSLLPSSHRYQRSHKRHGTWTYTKGCTEDRTSETPTWISVRGRKYTREPENVLAGKGRKPTYC